MVYEGKTDQFGVVAVKMLDRMFQENAKEFQVEVNVIVQTHHKNLVRLIGYCNQNQHRLLVYEFMKNGTLASFLFGGLRPRWYQRIQIACGLARGLVYLHEDCSTQIIHCDIKPQNVLLDEYYNARISDFRMYFLIGSGMRLYQPRLTFTASALCCSRSFAAGEMYSTWIKRKVKKSS